MRNGAGFNGHPNDCGKFVQCYFGNAGIKAAVIQECPWGNFWSQESLTCQPAGMVKCPNGRQQLLMKLLYRILRMRFLNTKRIHPSFNVKFYSRNPYRYDMNDSDSDDYGSDD